jgi:hypothetical protein
LYRAKESYARYMHAPLVNASHHDGGNRRAVRL